MKKFMDVFTRITDKICYYVNYFSMATIAIMMVLITVDVILKQVFGSPIAGAYEISQVLLSTLIFSSWAYVQSVHGHIHVTLFISRFHKIPRFICYGLTSLISAGTLGIATYAVYFQILSKKASGECTGVLMIPYWPFLIFEMVAFGLLTIILLRDAIKAVLAMFNEVFAEEVQSTWV